MLGFLKNLFGSKKQETVEQAPYKVEAPVVSQPTEKPTTDWPFPTPVAATPVVEEKPKKKPAARKPAGEMKPAVKAKTARTKKKAS